jgi:predicted nucleotidyltransferase
LRRKSTLENHGPEEPPTRIIARGQQWESADADIRAFVERVIGAFRERLGEALVGVYLHGSLAMGCFRRARSDLDLLVMVRGALAVGTRRDLARMLVALSDARPTPGDLELSVLQERHTRAFAHPSPFELHYSEDWKEAIRRGETDFAKENRDRDLAAHCTVTRARGVHLCGAPIAEAFGPVPWEAYKDAVLYDFDWLVDAENVLESPVYAVLNLCRVLQQLVEEPGTVVASKEEGGLWGLAHLPEVYRPIIGQALGVYRSGREVGEADRRTGGVAWDAAALRRFRDFANGEVTRLGKVQTSRSRGGEHSDTSTAYPRPLPGENERGARDRYPAPRLFRVRPVVSGCRRNRSRP